MKPSVLYHGSAHRVAALEPRQASGVGAATDQLQAVYATHDRILAVAFAMRGIPNQKGDLEWELKTSTNPPRIIYSAGTPRIGGTGLIYHLPSDAFEAVDE